MLWSLAILLVCEALGEVIHAVIGLPVPGPVIGIAVLLLALAHYASLQPASAPTLPAADGLLSYLPLFFVPPGVSAVMQITRLAHVWPAVMLGLIGSSVLTFAVAGWLAQGLLERQARRAARADHIAGRLAGGRIMIHLWGVTLTLSDAVAGWLQLAGTLLAYEAGLRLQRRLGGSALVNPVLVAVLLVSATLTWGGVTPADYAVNTRLLGFLLGPATVALAVPLYRNLPRIRQAFGPVLVSVLGGVTVSSVSVVAITAALGAPSPVLLSIAPKTATAAVAMAVSAEIGGDPSLTAGVAVLTGILGAVICTGLLDRLGVRDPRARGLATGIAAHGIGTARMLTLDAEAGAFAGLGMGLAGVTMGALMPLAVHLFRLCAS